MIFNYPYLLPTLSPKKQIKTLLLSLRHEAIWFKLLRLRIVFVRYLVYPFSGTSFLTEVFVVKLNLASHIPGY
jgi:hypothetical protein